MHPAKFPGFSMGKVRATSCPNGVCTIKFPPSLPRMLPLIHPRVTIEHVLRVWSTSFTLLLFGSVVCGAALYSFADIIIPLRMVELWSGCECATLPQLSWEPKLDCWWWSNYKNTETRRHMVNRGQAGWAGRIVRGVRTGQSTVLPCLNGFVFVGYTMRGCVHEVLQRWSINK